MSNLISRIELLSRSKKIYRVLFEDDFQIEIVEDTLLHFSLSKGSSIRDDLIHAIQYYDKVMRCVHQAYRFLSRRPHLEAEIKRKLSQKRYDKDQIQEAVQKLKTQGLINDNDFIRLFIREESRRKKSGPVLIRKKLYEKGASLEQVDIMISSEYPDELMFQNGLELWMGYRGKSTFDSKKMFQNRIRFLQQKGYTFDLIQEVMGASNS